MSVDVSLVFLPVGVDPDATSDDLNRRAGFTRVAYVACLTAQCNNDLWWAFMDQWNGALLTQESVQAIVTDWSAMYNNSQKPENAKDCYRSDDIDAPNEIEAALREHAGFVLWIEVD